MDSKKSEQDIALRVARDAMSEINQLSSIELFAGSSGHSRLLVGCSAALAGFYAIVADPASPKDDCDNAIMSITRILAGIMAIGHMCAAGAAHNQSDIEKQESIVQSFFGKKGDVQ